MPREGADDELVEPAPSERDGVLVAAALAVAGGALASGPGAMALSALHPQPPWQDAATFIAHYHPLQQAPYWLGLVLLSGSILFVARAVAIGGARHRTSAAVGLVARSRVASSPPTRRSASPAPSPRRSICRG